MSDMYTKEKLSPNTLYETRPNGTLRVATVNTEPTRTQQQFKDECDVNLIMKKYHQTGEIYHINRKQGVYADLSEVGDFQQMLHTVMEVQHTFDTLPAEVRAKFHNDPAELIEFVKDPKNFEEGLKLGIYENKRENPALNKNDSNDKKPAEKNAINSEPSSKKPDEK